MNDFEQRGRAEKVAAIVEHVELLAAGKWDLDPLADAEEVARRLRALSEAQWHELQLAAGYTRKKPPSAETQALVIEVFEKRIDFAGESERQC